MEEIAPYCHKTQYYVQWPYCIGMNCKYSEAIMELTVTIGAIAGAVLSLAFNITPGLKTAYESKAPEVKQQIMLILLAVGGVTLFGVSCLSPPFNTGVTCDVSGGWTVVVAFVTAVTTNFGVYGGTKYLFE